MRFSTDVVIGALIVGLAVGFVMGIAATVILVADPLARKVRESRSRLVRNQIRAATRAIEDEHPTFAAMRPW